MYTDPVSALVWLLLALRTNQSRRACDVIQGPRSDWPRRISKSERPRKTPNFIRETFLVLVTEPPCCSFSLQCNGQSRVIVLCSCPKLAGTTHQIEVQKRKKNTWNKGKCAFLAKEIASGRFLFLGGFIWNGYTRNIFQLNSKHYKTILIPCHHYITNNRRSHH